MKLPNIKFVIDKKMMIDDIESFLCCDNSFMDWAVEQVTLDHKDLINQIKDKNNKEQKETISNYVENYVDNNKSEIELEKDKLEKYWKSIEKKLGSELGKILNTDWKNINEITCNIGIFQVYPRDLDKFTTQIFYKSTTFYSAATILHEITHFIYFKKWRELFPEDELETFESPHPFWHLSEIMAPIINNEESIRRILPDAVIDTFPEYLKPYNDNQSIYGFFIQKYLEFKENNKNIEDLLRFGREEIIKIKFQ